MSGILNREEINLNPNYEMRKKLDSKDVSTQNIH